MTNNSFNVSTEVCSGTLRCGATELLTFSVSRPVFAADFEACSLPLMNQYSQKTSEDFTRYARGCMYHEARYDYIKNNSCEIPFHTYDATQIFEIPYNQSCCLSLYFDQYRFTGGAHGATTRCSATWRAGLRCPLTLADFFPCQRNLAGWIQQEIIRQIRVQMENGEKEYFDNYAQLVAKTWNPCSFYLVPEGVAIYFQQYDIAPYVMGIPVFIIPCPEPF